MASDLELKAKEAFEDDNYDLAYDLLTQAIGLSPNNADLYADRAKGGDAKPCCCKFKRLFFTLFFIKIFFLLIWILCIFCVSYFCSLSFFLS